MPDWNGLLTIVIGLALRIGLPIAATAVVILFLRKLDNRWRSEAEEHLSVPVVIFGKPCWEVKNCDQEKKKKCPAAAQTVSPCWQVFRTGQGTLKETCLGCDVFRLAPLSIGD